MDAPVKFVVVRLRNHSNRPRRLSLTGYFELVLGEWRHANLLHIVTEKDPLTEALFARNAYSREYGGRVVFAQVSERDRTVTGNRTEFMAANAARNLSRSYSALSTSTNRLSSGLRINSSSDDAAGMVIGDDQFHTAYS